MGAGGTNAVNAGISDPRPARGDQRRRADRPRRPAPARAPGGTAPAGGPRRPDGSARGRALRRRAPEDGDRVAAQLGRRAPQGARARRPGHAPAGIRARGVGRPDRRPAVRAAAGGRAERLPGRAPRAAPPRPRALARPAARRVRVRRLGAGGDPPARRAAARRERGADRRGRRARPSRPTSSPSSRPSSARIRCANGPASC